MPYRIDNFSPYRVHQRCAPTFRVGRVLLAGDAAHACNPCGGLGLTGGVIDADALSDVLGAVIQARGRARARLLRPRSGGGCSSRYLDRCRPIFMRLLSEKDPARRAQDKAERTTRTGGADVARPRSRN